MSSYHLNAFASILFLFLAFITAYCGAWWSCGFACACAYHHVMAMLEITLRP